MIINQDQLHLLCLDRISKTDIMESLENNTVTSYPRQISLTHLLVLGYSLCCRMCWFWLG